MSSFARIQLNTEPLYTARTLETALLIVANAANLQLLNLWLKHNNHLLIYCNVAPRISLKTKFDRSYDAGRRLRPLTSLVARHRD
jgi:hypothetical protein